MYPNSARYDLSIAIPVYNREHYILDTIESVLNALKKTHLKCQIVVSDNCSTDGTVELINKFTSMDNFILSVNDRNYGADYNYLKVADLCEGEYIHFLGSDDEVVVDIYNSIEKFVNNSETNILLCNRLDCSLTLENPKRKYWLDRSIREFVVRDDTGVEQYLNKAISTGAVFSYLSCIIVRKNAWKMYANERAHLGTAYSHAYVLLKILKLDKNLQYISDHLIKTRIGNDSFLDNNDRFSRVLLDFIGYDIIYESLDFIYPSRYKLFNSEYGYIRLFYYLIIFKSDRLYELYLYLKKFRFPIVKLLAVRVASSLNRLR